MFPVGCSHPSQRLLQPGDHACFFYRNEAEHDSMLSSFVAEGAARHDRVLYLCCNHNPEELRGVLRMAELIKLREDIPVILYTGYVTENCADAAARIGVRAILSKPFSAADLARTVRSVLETK